MSLFRVACLLNRWQRASSARCLQNKARGLTTPRSSKPPFPDSADVIGAEIEVSQRWALRKHSSKALCPGRSDLIVTEIEVSQRCALPQLLQSHCQWSRSCRGREPSSFVAWSSLWTCFVGTLHCLLVAICLADRQQERATYCTHTAWWPSGWHFRFELNKSE